MKILFAACCVFLSSFLFAQSNNEFWFAAPEVSAKHGDSPIELWVTTYDLEITLTLSFPATPSVQPIRETIPSNTFKTLDLTRWKRNLEVALPDSVLNQGLLVQANGPVAVQYAVRGNGNNMDVFSLKGKNALGTSFLVPAQAHYPNQDFFNGVESLDAYSSVDLVATQDSTEITITPSNDAIGHAKGQPFTIKLNRGQVYSLRALGLLADEHLGGTRITANKKIAVTVKDDSVLKGNNWDLIGDQIVPITAYDTTYVTLAGEIYVQSVMDGTQFTYQGLSYSLDEGETQYFEQLDTFSFLHADQPVGVFQLVEIEGVIGSELAGGVLGAWNCHRNSRGKFYRTTDEEFSLFVITDAVGLGHFTLDGASWDLSTLFSEVPHSNGLYAAQIDQDFLTDSVQTNLAHTIENTSSDFIFSYKFGSSATGAGYAYLSNFGFVELGDTLLFCENTTARLTAGADYDSYLWNTGETTSSISITIKGDYYVDVTQNTCVFSDTVAVDFVENVDLNLSDTTFCEGTTLQLDFPSHWTLLLNKKQVVSPLLFTKTATQELYAVNEYQCFDQASFKTQMVTNPTITLGNDTSLCSGETLTLGEYKYQVRYEWSTGDTTETITVNQPGVYRLRSFNECGSSYSDIQVYTWDFVVPNTITPNGDGVNDFFEIQTDAPGIWQVEIYNRWGRKVYASDNYQGEFDANGLSSGTYYVKVKSEGATCTEVRNWLYILR